MVTSTNTSNPGFIAMCMDNFDTVTVTGNDLSYYAIGFCIQTSGARIYNNRVSFTCNGGVIDPHVEGVEFYANDISNSYDQCGDFGSYGIAVFGGQDAHVHDNTFSGIHNNGPAAGVIVADDPCTEDALTCLANPGVTVVANGNKITNNILTDNDLDLWRNSTGTGNVFRRNSCSSSIPKGLCGND
jgi:hypothetical protein